MDGTLLKHKNDILELVNEKIADIHHDVHNDGGEAILDSEELQELLMCVKILKKLGKIRWMDHEIKMDYHEKGGNPYSSNPHNPGVSGAANVSTVTPQPHGHGYGTIQFTTMN